MLNDADEKTRANAAGAIGNLVRNGGELCEVLCQSGAPGLLVTMSLYDPSVFSKVSGMPLWFRDHDFFCRGFLCFRWELWLVMNSAGDSRSTSPSLTNWW